MAESRLAKSVEQKFSHRQEMAGGDRGNPLQLSPPMVTVQLCVVVTIIVDGGLKIKMTVSRPI